MKKLLLVLLASISLSSFGQIVQVTTSSTNENCGHSNGTVTATPTGGSCGFYTYMWNTLPQQATQTVTGLHAGTYTVTVVCGTDSAISSATVTNIPGPSVSILSITNSSCGLANGSAAANAIGGTAPYNYQWSDGQTSPVILNIAAGVYTVTLTDANNCTSTANATISTTPAPILTTSTTPETCGMANGTVSANASGGSGWYAFAWSNGETVPFATGLTMGTYTVSVSDSICTTTATCNVMEIPGPTAGFSMVADSITPHHYYIINNAAGIPPLTYLWSWGDGTYDSTAFPSHTYSSAGYYIICLTITDSTGTKGDSHDETNVAGDGLDDNGAGVGQGPAGSARGRRTGAGAEGAGQDRPAHGDL